MKILVTGGGGFLGRYIVEALVEQGHQVTVLCRGEYSFLNALDVSVVRADLTDREAVRQACKNQQVVFHVAAKTGPWGDYGEFYQTNVVGTQHIIDGCVAGGVQKLVYTSSPSVLSFFDDLSGVDESHSYPNFRVNAYQETKMLAEKKVVAANGMNGLMTVCLRPHAIWGPRDTQLFAHILSQVKQNKLKIIGNGKNRISVSYVENTAEAHLQAMASKNVGGKVYFINESEPVEMWSWISSMCQELGLPPITKRVNYHLAYAVAAICEKVYQALPFLGDPPATRALVATCGKDHFFDISAAQRDFGLRSSISMEEATKRFKRYYQDSDLLLDVV